MKPTAGLSLVLVSLATVACSGDGSGPDYTDHESGAITFNFLGPRDGSFSAVGGIRLDGDRDAVAGTWAAGAQATGVTDGFAAVGFELAGGERGDIFLISFEGLEAPGTFHFDGNCGPESGCPVLLFALDTTLGTDTDIAWLCRIDIGTAVVTELSATRLAGTFGGAGACLSSSSFQVIVITGGVFDVPIIEEYSLGFGTIP